jgi:signal peptidase I
MGDHRGGSQDSRAHLADRWHGTIPADHVLGRAFAIVWPAGRASGLPVPAALQRSLAFAAPPLLPVAALPLPPIRRAARPTVRRRRR